MKKPWGYEYLCYENEHVGLWFLYVEKDHQTSLHCHPKKTTGLILLDGEAEISFLADKRTIKSIDKLMIRRGLFHSTKSLSDGGSFIFEIETPVDKKDLVRLNDKYGRTSKPYEDSSFESAKNEDCLWIKEPDVDKSNHYDFSNCKLTVENISSLDSIIGKKDDDIIVFLRGGMIRTIDDISHCVTVPGDVGKGNIVKKVARQLDGLKPETIIMTINKND